MTTWRWVQAKCKLTPASTLTWLAPLIAFLTFEEQWRLVAAICIAIGIALSHGSWRRLLGVALSICIVFWRGQEGSVGPEIFPAPVLFFWVGGFFLTSFADREKSKQERDAAEQEWG